jgi:hypothetical protein
MVKINWGEIDERRFQVCIFLGGNTSSSKSAFS